MSDVRLLLADEHRICLDALSGLLGREMSIVETTTSSVDLLSKVARLTPDVVLIRLSGRTSEWFRALRTIRTKFPTTEVVVVAADRNQQLIDRAVSAGAAACVPATHDSTRLVQAIRRAAKNSGVSKRTGRRAGRTDTDTGQEAPVLNERQVEILGLLVQGMSSKQIAGRLNVSQKTVEFHKYRMMALLRVENSAELIVAALRMGIGPAIA